MSPLLTRASCLILSFEQYPMRRFSYALLLSLFLVRPALGWGPHGQITQAAIDALGTNHPIVELLGQELAALTNYCWIPDYKQLPFHSGSADFYSDDYLLFPRVSRHLDHICPEVQQTYEPYFRRALSAVRYESPANAARWIGSLLHFVQDSGSPPHAARIRGEIHIRMENWVDPLQIKLPQYQPQLLGTNEEEAVRGVVERMNGLIEFSGARGKKLRGPVILSQRRAVRQVVLESALECARVSADVLHTLGVLSTQKLTNSITIAGKVSAQAPASSARFPARVFVPQLNLATLCSLSGEFVVRGIPAGSHLLRMARPGSATLETNLILNQSVTNLDFKLAPSGNLVRNLAFSSHWILTNQPDCWTKMNGSWEGEVIPLQAPRQYRVRAEFLPGSEAEVRVRWAAPQPFVIPKPAKLPRIQTHRLTRHSPEFYISAGTNVGLLQLVIVTALHPTNELRAVSVVPEDASIMSSRDD